MKAFKNGLLTWLVLQLAMGPVFFFIINLTLQKTVYDGFIGALAVALVDFSYIALAVLGIGKFLEKKKIKKIFGIISSLILIIFGIIIIQNITNIHTVTNILPHSMDLLSSFVSVLLLTISNPLTIVLYTGILATKGIEKKYSLKELFIFGLAIGLATLLFMSTSVGVFSLIKWSIPIIFIQLLNLIVWCLLIGYGSIRLKKILTSKHTIWVKNS